MDAIDLQNGVHLFGLSMLCCLAIAIFAYCLAPDFEKPALYRVPVPEQCAPGWKGEVLENPSIKV